MSDALTDFVKTVLSECDRDLSDAEAAALVASRLTDAEYRELTQGLICKVIARVRRIGRLLPPRRKSRVSTSPSANPTTDRAAWLKEQILIPGRPSTTWGEATVADHLARIDYLRALCADHEKQINKHQQAIVAIRRSGVRRLAEIKIRTVAA